MQFQLTPAYQVSVALMGVSIALVQSQVAVALSSAEVAQVAKAITVRIESSSGSQGSGIIIKRQENIYFVLTADHVVSKSGQYQIITPDGESYQLDFKTKKSKSGTDLAVVQFNSSKTYSVAKIGNSDKATEGTVVYAAGFPTNTSTVTSSKLYRFLEGKITANASQPLDEGYSLVYSNSTLPGMSGGPVLNEQGEVIAVHGKAETTAQGSGESVKAVSTGNNLGISVNTFLRLALLDTGVRPPAVKIATAPKAEDLYLKAADKFEKANYQGALADLDEAIKINPNWDKAYNSRGNARANLGDWKGAVEDYNQALEINPNLAEAYYNRGNARKSIVGIHISQTIQDYNDAIRLNPNFAQAYRSRGIERGLTGDRQGAILDLTEAIRLNPNDIQAYIHRGYDRQALKDLKGGIEDFSQAIRLDRNNAFAYASRRSARRESGDYQGAVEDATQLIRLNSNSSNSSNSFLSYSVRGYDRLALKDLQGALADFNHAIDLKPNYGEIYIGRAIVYYELGKSKLAINGWRKAISLGSKSNPVTFGLAVAIYTTGNRVEGLKLGASAIKSDPRLADWQYLQKNLAWGDRLLSDAKKFLNDPKVRVLLSAP
jgi:tetratricopeptide (TPR) repeat protein/V8-like Glu-specific endopeptidase